MRRIGPSPSPPHLRPISSNLRESILTHFESDTVARPCPCGLAAQRLQNYLLSVLLDEQLSPEQAQALRRMSPAERWRVAHRLYWTMRRHKAAFLRAQHPDWSDQQLGDQVRRIFLHVGA